MRGSLWFLLGLIAALVLACGAGEKPEYVEVPSGDPMPADGEGEPIQDADNTAAEGCAALPPQEEYLPMPVDDWQDTPAKDEDFQGFKWAPLSPEQEQSKKRTLPISALLIVPIALALALKRNR